MSIYRMATVDVPTYEETASDSYTKLLLHCDGANGSTTFTDKIGKTVTPSGSIQISTAQSKFRGASAKFIASSDKLALSSSADFGFGSGDFTVEFWIYYTGGTFPADSRYISFGGVSGALNLTMKGGFGLVNETVAHLIQNTGVYPDLNAWTHIAYTRASGVIRMFKNGVQFASVSSSVGTATSVLDITCGLTANTYIDELRVSKGIARWTANFTPPTAPYDTTITQTPTNTNVPIKAQYRGLSGVNREVKQQYQGYSGVNRKVFESVAYLYNAGDENTTFTGGLVINAGTEPYVGHITKNASTINLTCTTSLNNEADIHTSNAIDLTNFTQLQINYTVNSYSVENGAMTVINGTGYKLATTSETKTIDVSELNGSYVIKLASLGAINTSVRYNVDINWAKLV